MGTIPEFEKARDFILYRLENELPPALTYHCLKHTVEEVVPAVDLLCTLEKVGRGDRLLLLTSAYYHDSGYIVQRKDHEYYGIQIAEQALPLYVYSPDQITLIRGIIQATHLPQSPRNLLESIMADADLDYLGQADFWERSKDLRQELTNYGSVFTDSDWLIYQENFIQAHKYFTASARSIREPLKQQHLQEIRAKLTILVR